MPSFYPVVDGGLGPYTRPMIPVAPGVALDENEIELTFIEAQNVALIQKFEKAP